MKMCILLFCIAAVFFTGSIIISIEGTHHTEYVLPNGDVLVIDDTGLPEGILSDGTVIEPIAIYDNKALMYFCGIGTIIFLIGGAISVTIKEE